MQEESTVVPWLYWSLLPVHRLFLRLYFSQLVIQGAEHLPAQGPLVLAPKHYSRWDPVIIARLSREPIWFMTNANQFGGVQGWFIQRLGAFPVDLNRPRVSSFRYAIDLLAAGQKLVLFPEGGIVRDQPLRNLKPGLARLVLQAETRTPEPIPILPIGLRYDPDPVWRGRVYLQIGPPLYSRDYRRESEKQTAQALTTALQAALLTCLELPQS